MAREIFLSGEKLLLNNNYCVVVFSLTYYIMFPRPMGTVVASLSSHCESGLESGGQAMPPITAACGGNGGQNFFEKHICSGLWQLKILEGTMVHAL